MTFGQAFEIVFLRERQQKQLIETHGLALNDLDPTDKNTICETAFGLIGTTDTKAIMNHFAVTPKAELPDTFVNEFREAVMRFDSENAVRTLVEAVGELKTESVMPFYDIES